MGKWMHKKNRGYIYYPSFCNSKVQVKYIWDIDKAPNILKRAVFWLNVIVPRFVSRRIDTSIYDWVITFKDDYQCNLNMLRIHMVMGMLASELQIFWKSR